LTMLMSSDKRTQIVEIVLRDSSVPVTTHDVAYVEKIILSCLGSESVQYIAIQQGKTTGTIFSVKATVGEAELTALFIGLRHLKQWSFCVGTYTTNGNYFNIAGGV
jgi:hypothetical protein